MALFTTSTRQGAEDTRLACEYGPLATCRKRLAVACRCVACDLKTGTDPRVRRLLEIGRSYAKRFGPLPALTAALHDVDAVAAEAGRRASGEVRSVFEGLRAGEAAATARRARTAAAAVRWALGTGEVAPAVPADWNALRPVLADPRPAPVCEPAWRTTDVLALARLAQNGGTSVLPILADALQDAGCADDRILDHCRSAEPHTSACWVPDLVLDTE
jgi:hypothetical protein